MLKDMIQNIIAKQKHTLRPDRNLFIYSAHDITLINFMRTLGLAHNLKPEYGAAFVMEAHVSPVDDFQIKMYYYNNSSSKTAVEIKMGKCGDPCYLSNFIIATSDMIPDDWEKECGN